MKQRLAGFLLLLALALSLASGCHIRESLWGWTVGAQPYTKISGAPVRLKPGFGGEVSLLAIGEDSTVYIHLGRFFWTHHEGRNGGPSAEYLRLGTSVGMTAYGQLYPEGRKTWANGVGVVMTAAWHQLLVNNGHGSRGGPGLSLGREAWFGRERCRFSFGCTAEGWVSTVGDFIGALSPYLQIGIGF